MVFTSTTPWKPGNVIFFFKKLEIDAIEFCPYPEFPYAEKRNRPGFVNISPTLVIDTSTERSSRVLQHGNQKFFFFFKKVRNWIWLVLKSWYQHSSRSHLYVDIGDASSSLWGSTSSLICFYHLPTSWFRFRQHQPPPPIHQQHALTCP